MNYKLVNSDIKENYIQQLLLDRGLTVSLSEYMDPPKTWLQDYRALDNIIRGVKLVQQVDKTKKYALIVDSDCDGFTSSSIFYQYIKRVYPEYKCDYYLHTKKQHGLEDQIEAIIDNIEQYSLVVIPDAGSNDLEQHRMLNDYNIPCLILDHHIVEKDEIVPNVTLINNHYSTNYVNKDLTGAGVVYQFCRALDDTLGVNYSSDYLDLAALGIIGDMGNVLSLENRYIIKNGLENIKNIFFKEAIEKQAFSMKGVLSPISVAFYIVPLINAMIRVGTMDEKERLFLGFIDGNREVPSNKRGCKGQMERVAIESIRECTNAHRHQKTIKENIVESLEAKIFKYDLLENKILMIPLEDDDTFPSELNGLVAMQLSKKYNRPTIVARLNSEGFLRGSARGLDNSPIDSFKDLLESSELFEYTAGHDNAFGVSILDSHVDSLHKLLNQRLENTDLSEGCYDVNFVRHNYSEDLSDLIIELDHYKTIWGTGNSTPKIVVTELSGKPSDFQIMGRNNDTLKFKKKGIEYIKFFAKDLIGLLQNFGPDDDLLITIIGEPSVNEWGGKSTPQIIISDMEMKKDLIGF